MAFARGEAPRYAGYLIQASMQLFAAGLGCSVVSMELFIGQHWGRPHRDDRHWRRYRLLNCVWARKHPRLDLGCSVMSGRLRRTLSLVLGLLPFVAQPTLQLLGRFG